MRDSHYSSVKWQLCLKIATMRYFQWWIIFAKLGKSRVDIWRERWGRLMCSVQNQSHARHLMALIGIYRRLKILTNSNTFHHFPASSFDSWAISSNSKMRSNFAIDGNESFTLIGIIPTKNQPNISPTANLKTATPNRKAIVAIWKRYGMSGMFSSFFVRMLRMVSKSQIR